MLYTKLIIKQHGGWMSEKVAHDYIEASMRSKQSIAGQILGTKPTATVTSSNVTVEANACGKFFRF